MNTNYIGKAVNRVDGPKKVKGEAKYTAEFFDENLAYGVVITAAITKGRIAAMNTERAKKVAGVIEVFTHENRPHVSWFNRDYKDQDAPKGEHFRALYDDEIFFSGQPIALVVAENFEAARYAASLIEVLYHHAGHSTDLHAVKNEAYDPGKGKTGFEPPASRGDANEALKQATSRIEAEYEHSAHYHNPMETHASTVIFEPKDESYTIYDKTQGTANSQTYVCSVFGLPKKKVRVMAPFIGGAFGSALRPQYQLYLAVLAAKALKRSVRVVLTRQQMFTFGRRPHTIQKIQMGTDSKGLLKAIRHEAVAETSTFEDYTEIVVNWSGQGYKCDNVDFKYEIAKVDLYTPLDMRAPGATTGVFALECAIDEMAVAAGKDPLEFRIANYTDNDQMHKGRPYSSKALREAYQQGAEKFGWSKRNPEPGSMTDGRWKIGWGVATGFWDAMQQKAAARVKLDGNGRLEVTSAITDIGTGTYTIMAQIAADTMGLPIDTVDARIGDTDLPPAPLQGGSWTAASVGSAVEAACFKLREEILKTAQKMPESPLEDLKIDDVEFKNAKILSKKDSKKFVQLKDVVQSTKERFVAADGSTAPDPAKQEKYSRNTHSAVFVEVRVDEELGTVGVSRVVSVIAAGRILNPKTARSQILGGVVWGISMALHEESFLDHKAGKFMNHNFAEYHIPVNRDIGNIDVIFVEEHDEIVSPMGVKGLGEIGIVGVASAVANAIYHATGKRVRKLPITIDKLL